MVVSSDGIRAEWYGDENILGDASKIFREVELRCRAALFNDRNVVMDATNLNAKKRKNFLNQMPTGHQYKCVVMCTPFDECYARDCKRERHVGFEVLARMVRNFQMPYYNEGWDKIELVFPPHDVELIGHDHLQEELVFDQKNHHHSMTVGEHEQAAANYASDNDFPYLVRCAANWHDCGKIHTQSPPDSNGDCHYRGHDSVSAYYYITSYEAGWMVEIGNEDAAIKIATMVTWHMVPYQFEKSDYPREEFLMWARSKDFDEEMAENIWQLHLCDVAAH